MISDKGGRGGRQISDLWLTRGGRGGLVILGQKPLLGDQHDYIFTFWVWSQHQFWIYYIINSPLPVSQGCWCLVDPCQREIWRGHWVLDTGHWTLDTGHWTLDTGHLTLDTGHWTQCHTVWHCVTQSDTVWNYLGRGPKPSSNLVCLVTEMDVKSQSPERRGA